jgi:hypothetical protein
MQSHSSLFAYNGMNQADELNSTQNESEKVLNLIFLNKIFVNLTSFRCWHDKINDNKWRMIMVSKNKIR